jgi:hypothetical protein
MRHYLVVGVDVCEVLPWSILIALWEFSSIAQLEINSIYPIDPEICLQVICLSFNN